MLHIKWQKNGITHKMIVQLILYKRLTYWKGSRNIAKSAKGVTMSLEGSLRPPSPASASDSLGVQSCPPHSSDSLKVLSLRMNNLKYNFKCGKEHCVCGSKLKQITFIYLLYIK